MLEFINSLTGAVTHANFLSYAVIALIFFLESLVAVGMVIPGAAFTFLLGFLASSDYVEPWLTLGLAIGAAFVGEAVSYSLGRRGSQLFNQGHGYFQPANLERANAFFQKHGAKSIIFGRFLGPIKAVLPFAAGVSGLNRKRFLTFNLLSVALWVGAYFFLGYFFGQAWDTIKLWTTRAEIFVLVLVFIVVLFYLFERILLRRGRRIFEIIASLASSVTTAIVTNPDVKKLVQRYPRFFSFLKNRFAKTSFYGLPLTLLVLAFVYLLTELLGVTEDILNYEVFVQLDQRVESLILAFRDPLFINLFLWLTLLGKNIVVIVFALGASLILWLSRKKEYIISLWLTVTGSQLFAVLGKSLLHRSRPAGAYYFEPSYSFPSSHATVAVAFYGFLAYAIWRVVPSWRKRLQALFAAIGLAVIIGLSRIYLDVHYLSDVSAGYLLGGLWLLIGISICEWQIHRRNIFETVARLPRAGLKAYVAGVMILLTAFFGIYGLLYEPKIRQLISVPTEAEITDNILDSFDRFRLSRYSEMLDGQYQEPLSFIIVAKNDADLNLIMSMAGWLAADETSFKSVYRIARAALLNQAYDRAPMTPSFWRAEVNDFAFEKPTAEQSVRERHHARFWKTNFITPDHRQIYVGTASLDIGIKWWITHQIDPDIDTEREYLFADIKNTGAVTGAQKQKFVDPVLGKNASGDQFFTDGQIYIIDLK